MLMQSSATPHNFPILEPGAIVTRHVPLSDALTSFIHGVSSTCCRLSIVHTMWCILMRIATPSLPHL